ncbi:methyltransferase [Kiritimatiellota bacterium B12222]|nr:methyltransferase [Kiritimatiellota bacterium B12222]
MHPPHPLPEPAQAALMRLEKLCPMRYQDFSFQQNTLQIWTACDIDPLLNALMEKDPDHPDVQDERMPYWAELWPSSLLMAETIALRHSHLPSGPWLELGCGPGLPGILAAQFGRKGVCSDYMQEALWLAELNAHQNGCADHIRFKRLDWREPDLSEHFRWILAGDVAYENRNFSPLLKTFDQLLSPDGEIWLGEPGRSVARPFFQAIEAEGWQREVIGQQAELSLHRIWRT